MNLTINPRAPLPIYAQVMEQLRDLILGGSLGPGETLPSVRQMAETLEINSLTIQKAYKGLEADGLITIKKGVGASVCKDVVAPDQFSRNQLIQTEMVSLIRKARTLGISKDNFVKMIEIQWGD